MHIADGIVPAGWCVAAHVASFGALTLLGRRVEAEEVVRMGMMAAMAFVASLIHFPLAGTSVHLGLFGLTGILLGVRSFPVIYTALLFQALLFQHGGLLTLGLNAINMGLGGLAAALLWSLPKLPDAPRAFLAGFAGVLLPALLMATEFRLAGYGKGFFVIATIYVAAAALEGAITVAMVSFFRRVKPAMLERLAA